MKKIGTLNQPLSAVIAGLGHMDTLVVADAGLPIPPETQRIDLALTKGVPPFLETLKTVLSELQVESAIVAEEMTSASPDVYQGIIDLMGSTPINIVSHEAFKNRSASAAAVIRTGEFTPYANIILIAGVVF